MSAPLRCFFCGGELKNEQGAYSCAGCKARFKVRTDPEGCVLGLEVAECGAEECCRHRK